MSLWQGATEMEGKLSKKKEGDGARGTNVPQVENTRKAPGNSSSTHLRSGQGLPKALLSKAFMRKAAKKNRHHGG